MSIPPDDAYVDPDPSTTYDPHPAVTSVRQTLQDQAPEQLGGIYRTPDGVIHVGIVGDAGTGAVKAKRLARAAAPNAELHFHAAKHTWGTLQTIADQLTEAMARDPASGLVSLRANPYTNQLDVGVSNIGSPLAGLIKAQYGDAVSIFEDDPIEPLSGVGMGRTRRPR